MEMSMLTILTEENRLLRQKAKRVDKIDDSIRNICASMIDTMVSSNGVGLSGNQVGILKRIIIVLNENKPIPMINPEIKSHSESTVMLEEGCLSIPDTFIPKNRYESILVRYRDLKGKPHFETYTGLTARIIQHEIDHLDGLLMIDN